MKKFSLRLTIDISNSTCYIFHMNKIETQRRQFPYRRKKTFLCLLVFLFGVLFEVFSLAGPVELILNTVIPSTSEFMILEPSPVGLTLGTPKTVGYTYNGNSLIYLTITSSNPSGTNQMRMKHTELAYYIPYTMTLDYDGMGSEGQTPVHNNFKRLLGGFNNGYDLTGTFVITTAGSENYLEGDYADTITFTLTTN